MSSICAVAPGCRVGVGVAGVVPRPIVVSASGVGHSVGVLGVTSVCKNVVSFLVFDPMSGVCLEV